MNDVPHIAFPLRLTALGTLATVDQGSQDDVEQCVRVLLNTPVGTRPLAPEVGISDPTFTEGMDDRTAAELMRDEPRASIEIHAGPVAPGYDELTFPDQALLPDLNEVPNGQLMDGRQAVRVIVALVDDADDTEVQA